MLPEELPKSHPLLWPSGIEAESLLAGSVHGREVAQDLLEAGGGSRVYGILKWFWKFLFLFFFHDLPVAATEKSRCQKQKKMICQGSSGFLKATVAM